MVVRTSVHLYCEDRGHEDFARALVHRLADEEDLTVQVETRSGRGGHGRALGEFKKWQRAIARGMLTGIPDLLVIVIDGNCDGWNAARQTVQRAVDGNVFPASVVGCPDPHVERWCIADPTAFQAVVEGPPLPDPGKCERALYKNLLRDSIRAAGQPIITSEMEYAPDIVAAMDLFRAGRAQPSLGHFIEALRATLRMLER